MTAVESPGTSELRNRFVEHDIRGVLPPFHGAIDVLSGLPRAPEMQHELPDTGTT